jgi:hypothetical protein
MKLGDFLNNLARKCNKENDPALVAILSNSELANRDVADEFANAIDRELMSLDGAKNNPLVRTHFASQALNGVDTELLNLATELELGDDVVNQFKTEKNTYNKLRSLKDTIKSIKDKKIDETDPKKKAEYEQQIQELNAKIATVMDDNKVKIESMNKAHQQEITDYMIKVNLMGKSFANKELPQDVQFTVANTILHNELSKKGAVLVRDGEVLKLKQKDNLDLDYLENHKPVTFDDFTNKVLADNKLLAVSGGAIPPNTPPIPTTISAGGKTNTVKFDSAMAASMADIKPE